VKFLRPPVNEVGLSVSFAEPTLYNPYDFRAVHDLFRSDYPVAQKVDPTQGNDTEISVGLPPLLLQNVSRWWLISPDNANVLQIQENYFAVNWRRLVGIDTPPTYPGFESLLADFERDLAKLLAISPSEPPAVRSCELMYDDIIPGLVEDNTVKLSEMVTFWKPGHQAAQMAGWQCAWLEPLQLSVAGETGNLQIQFLAAGFPQEDSPPRPIVRVIWKASTLAVPLERVPSFFREAHSHISRRFEELITSRLRDSWK
jgi:uncharacterized protein (TIGR04255 family)